jgi:hypothetical protein
MTTGPPWVGAARVRERLSNLGACGPDERLQQLLAAVLVLDQLSPICGMAYRTDRFERSVGQRHEIRILGEQLNPKPCMIGGCPKAIRLGICGIEIRAWSIVALEDEPETDDSSSEFGDRPGKTAVGRYSLLAQPLVPSESLGASCVNALKYVSDDGPQQRPRDRNYTSEQGLHA